MNKALSITTTALLLLLIANVFIDVVLRYAFNNSSIALQELEWHLFSAMFLLSIAYGLQNDTHVRVDVFYLNFSLKTQAFIDIIGSLVFILPISLLIAYYGFDFAYLAFEIGEKSGDPDGLYYRFIIKSIIPISFILVIVSGVIFAKNHYIRAFK